MKKNKYLVASFLLSGSVLLGACSDNKADDNEKENKVSVSQTNTFIKGDITIRDLKAKYGEVQLDEQKIAPLYNVDAKEVFEFTLTGDLPNGLTSSDLVTVHTDSKGLPESKIRTSNFTHFVPSDGKGNTSYNVLTVSSADGVLHSNETLQEARNWGNAPEYFISINYDLKSGNFEKLEKPVIVPFTIKKEIDTPNVAYDIDPNGNFKITWTSVEEADYYNVYNIQSHITLGKKSNDYVGGPETGYDSAAVGLPKLLAGEVTKNEFNPDENGIKGNETFKMYQNFNTSGTYYITAVKDGKESKFSVPVDTSALSKRLPFKLEQAFIIVPTVDKLPTTSKVEFIDGTIEERKNIYKEVNEQGNVVFSVEGTELYGSASISTDSNVKTELETRIENDKDKKDDNKAGYIEPENETDQIPSKEVPTIIETEEKKEEVKEEKNLIEEQKENTEKIISEGDKEGVVVPKITNDVFVNADSAFEEYLALKLINGEKVISLKAFPDYQNFTKLEDVFLKVVYQNPLILGVEAYSYDYSNYVLTIEFGDTQKVIAKKQKEIITEANKIVKNIVKKDMTDEQIRLALYNYLNDNTTYDNEALETAKKNNYETVDSKYNDSFTTYGIMVKKVGVCASYSSTYLMLLELAGVDAIVVTGFGDGVPHAWNKVKINDEWYHIDPTSNETNSGVSYMAYQINDDTAVKTGLKEDKLYWLDNEISTFKGTKSNYDYFISKGLVANNQAEYKKALENAIKINEDQIVVRMDTELDEDVLMNTAKDVLTTHLPKKVKDATVYMAENFILINFE